MVERECFVRLLSRASTAIIIVVFVFSMLSRPALQAELPHRSKALTFMVYSCGDCDLEGYQLGYMTQMASVGSTLDVDIVVQMDRIGGYSSEYGDWTDCKRFYVTHGLTPTSENAIESLGEVSMGDPGTLADFFAWAVQEYPADRFFAMMIGHGWIDGVCPDWSDESILTPLEIRWALSQVKNTTGIEIDVIGIEGCQQAALEIAYEIGDSSGLIIASEEVSTHWPYSYILSDLVASPTMDSNSMASMIVDLYAQFSPLTGGDIMTLSALNLTRIKTEVKPAAANLADSLIANLTRFAHAISDAASLAESHEPIWTMEEAASCRDLYDFAIHIEQQISSTPIQLAARNLINAIENACIAEWHGPGHPNYHGLYIYLPNTENVYNARTSIYGQTYSMAHPVWTQEATWDDLLFMLFRTYAAGLRSREQIADTFFTKFDSNNDSYLDALRITVDVRTNGEPLDVTAYAILVDPQGNAVDHYNYTWNIASSGGFGDIYLHMPSGAEEGMYSAEISIVDEHGIFEDEICMQQITLLPERMQHDVSAKSILATKTAVGQGCQAVINVTVCNNGHYRESLNVTTYANGAIVDTTQLTIPIGGVTTFMVQWNTAGQALGNYTITSFAEPIEGETNTTDNFFQCENEICVTIPGDVDADHDVDIFDIVRMADAYGTAEGQPRYDSNRDVNGNGDIDIFDVVIAAGNYGESW